MVIFRAVAAAIVLVVACFIGAPAAARDAPADKQSGAGLAEYTKIGKNLADDPIYVDKALTKQFGAGTWKSIAKKARAVDFPVYVVALAGVEFDDLVSASQIIPAAAEADGVYIVVSPGAGSRHLVKGLDDKEADIETLFNERYKGSNAKMSEIAWLEDLLPRLDEPAPETHVSAMSRMRYWTAVHPVGTVLIGLVTVAVLIAAVWKIARVTKTRRTRKTYRVPESVLAAAREAGREKLMARISSDALQVAGRLEEFDTSALTADQARVVQHGLDAYADASRIANNTGAEIDELAGALVLLAQSGRDLFDVEQAGSPAAARPAQLCSANPLHGDASGSGRIDATSGAQAVMAPLCKRCSAANRSGKPLAWLRVDGEPYTERDTVWADTMYGATGADLVRELTRRRAGGR